LQLDTYLLIGDSVILYNGPFTLQPRNYELNEIKKIVSYKYPKDGSIGYFLVFKDGTTVVIDDKGAVFVSERSGLPIIETQDFDF
jgi:hypothetical protein